MTLLPQSAVEPDVGLRSTDPAEAVLSLSCDGWVQGAAHRPSPNHDSRPADVSPSLLVIHNISLPPGHFGGPWIDDLFLNRLDASADPFFAGIASLRVSAHFLIRRDGLLVQYVSTSQRAWHAGVSRWQGRERCNDFSIGIELEGTDHEGFEPAQYRMLARLTRLLWLGHPLRSIAGHEDIAPGRKTDPGPCFDWSRYLQETGLPSSVRGAA